MKKWKVLEKLQRQQEIQAQKKIPTEIVGMEEGTIQVVLTIRPNDQSVQAKVLFNAKPSYDLLIGGTGLLRDQLVAERAVIDYRAQQQATATDSPNPH